MAPSTTFVGNPEDTDFNKSLQEELDSAFLKGKKKMTLGQLHEVTQRPKEELFMKLLWGAQRGDCTLSQTRPESFGDITVTKVVLS